MQVVQLRVGLRQLQLALRQRNTLRHREDVGVAYRDDINPTVKVFSLDRRLRAVHLVRILRRQVLREDLREQLQLFLLCCVETLVNRGQGLSAALQDGHCRANRSLLTHVLDLLVSHRHETTTCIDERTQQRRQCRRRLLVRKGDQTVPNRTTRNVDVAPLARLDWLVMPRNAHALGFETTR